MVARKDRQRAPWKLIDAAFEQFDKDPRRSSWTNYGGAATAAAVVAIAAKDVGHPDPGRGVAIALARRPTGPSRGRRRTPRSGRRSRSALALSFVDPTTARGVLASIAPPEEFVARVVTEERNWLFAVALVFPELAPEAIDRKLKHFLDRKSGRDGVSGSGLVELISILTADDRFETLAMYTSLPRMGREWQE